MINDNEIHEFDLIFFSIYLNVSRTIFLIINPFFSFALFTGSEIGKICHLKVWFFSHLILIDVCIQNSGYFFNSITKKEEECKEIFSKEFFLYFSIISTHFFQKFFKFQTFDLPLLVFWLAYYTALLRN